MPSREVEPLLGTGHFRVWIGSVELGFSRVSGLVSETALDPAERPEHRFATVVLRRALTSSHELYDWRRSVVRGTSDKRTVTIEQLSGPAGRAVHAWQLVNAWPVKWSGPELDATGNDVAMEELELAYDDLVWLEKPPRRSRKPIEGA
jgi:phage tail-like protein